MKVPCFFMVLTMGVAVANAAQSPSCISRETEFFLRSMERQSAREQLFAGLDKKQQQKFAALFLKASRGGYDDLPWVSKMVQQIRRGEDISTFGGLRVKGRVKKDSGKLTLSLNEMYPDPSVHKTIEMMKGEVSGETRASISRALYALIEGAAARVKDEADILAVKFELGPFQSPAIMEILNDLGFFSEVSLKPLTRSEVKQGGTRVFLKLLVRR